MMREGGERGERERGEGGVFLQSQKTHVPWLSVFLAFSLGVFLPAVILHVCSKRKRKSRWTVGGRVESVGVARRGVGWGRKV